MTREELIADFKRQFNETLDRYEEPDPKCAMAGGMLLILSALRRFDGPTIPLQVACMHTAVRQVGEERGWEVDRNKPEQS